MKSGFIASLLLGFTTFVFLFGIFVFVRNSVAADLQIAWWQMQAIDTMKYSRDLAREKLSDASFVSEIDSQMKKIRETGATHVSIGTPYDEEFRPYLKRWVVIARRYGLSVWFRGNFSGWEGWFGYSRINRDTHKEKLRAFLLSNTDLFEDGDIFTSCTECENGGPGDPRNTGDVSGHRQFLIDEHRIASDAFKAMKKDVQSNYFPMNGDVAKLAMDKPTTAALNGVVVIDHYVASPATMARDLEFIAEHSGGKIVLGEIGSPIPDIHGDQSEDAQAAWIAAMFDVLARNSNVIGVNYWVATGGSTALWRLDGTPKPAVAVLKRLFNPRFFSGVLVDAVGKPIKDVVVVTPERRTISNESGEFSLPYYAVEETVEFEKDGYITKKLDVINRIHNERIVLKRSRESLLFRLQKIYHQLRSSLQW